MNQKCLIFLHVWTGTALPQMDKKHLNNLPVLMGSEILILAQISEHRDLGFIPFATTKLQVAAEGGSLVTSNLRWPQGYWNMRVWVKKEGGFGGFWFFLFLRVCPKQVFKWSKSQERVWKTGLKVSEFTELLRLEHCQGRQMDCARVHHINR